MSKLNLLGAIAGIGFIAMSSQVLAADLPPPPGPAVVPPAPVQAPAPAPVVASWYVRGDAGVGASDNGSLARNDEAFSFGLGVGYKYNDWARSEIAFDFAGKYNNGLGSNTDAYSLMLNGYLDAPIWFGGLVAPYIGAGIGWGNALSDDGFAFALLAGLNINISENLVLDAGYKYRIISISGPDWNDHLFRAGLRWYFM